MPFSFTVNRATGEVSNLRREPTEGEQEAMPWLAELTRRIRALERSNRQLVERCNQLTRNMATMAAAFKAIIEAGEQEAAEVAEDEAEFERLQGELITLLRQNAAARPSAAGGDGGDSGEIDGQAPAGGAADVPPPYDGPASPPAPAAANGEGATQLA